jgi:hypothetical protein
MPLIDGEDPDKIGAPALYERITKRTRLGDPATPKASPEARGRMVATKEIGTPSRSRKGVASC